jgi:hypothetical protein
MWGETATLLDPVDRGNLNHWGTETDPVSETSCFSSNYIESGLWTKSENPVILCVIHHRQNTIESTGIYIRWHQRNQSQVYLSVSLPSIFNTWSKCIYAWWWSNCKVETCSKDYVHIERVTHVITSFVFNLMISPYYLKNVVFWDVPPCGCGLKPTFQRNVSPPSSGQVNNTRSTRCYIPEDDILHSHRCANLKSHIIYCVDSHKDKLKHFGTF